jgi:hypothetical protein
MLLSSKGYLSHLSNGTKGVSRGLRYTSPVGSGRQGGTPHPPPGAEQCPAAQRTSSDRLPVSVAFLHGKASCPINYHAPTGKSTTQGEGSGQLPRTEGNGHPRNTGVAVAAGSLLPGPTLYEVCSFRLKDSSVTSLMVQKAFLGGGVIPILTARGRRGGTPLPPPGAEIYLTPPPGAELSRAAPGG